MTLLASVIIIIIHQRYRVAWIISISFKCHDVHWCEHMLQHMLLLRIHMNWFQGVSVCLWIIES